MRVIILECDLLGLLGWVVFVGVKVEGEFLFKHFFMKLNYYKITIIEIDNIFLIQKQKEIAKLSNQMDNLIYKRDICIYLFTKFIQNRQAIVYIIQQYLQNTMTEQFYNVMQKQISPWTIYDQSGKKIQPQHLNIQHPRSQPQKQKQIQKQKQNKKHPNPNQNLNLNRFLKKQPSQKYQQLNNLLYQISTQKARLNDKLNILSMLQVIRQQLYQQTNPTNNTKINLPKINQILLKAQAQKVNKPRIRHNYYSQKLNAINDITQHALQDFSKIFISKSYHNNQHSKQLEVGEVKYKFPKFKKNKSLVLANLNVNLNGNNNSHSNSNNGNGNGNTNINANNNNSNSNKNQFTDNSINQVIQIAKLNYRLKRNSLSSLVYDIL